MLYCLIWVTTMPTHWWNRINPVPVTIQHYVPSSQTEDITLISSFQEVDWVFWIRGWQISIKSPSFFIFHPIVIPNFLCILSSNLFSSVVGGFNIFLLHVGSLFCESGIKRELFRHWCCQLGRLCRLETRCSLRLNLVGGLLLGFSLERVCH